MTPDQLSAALRDVLDALVTEGAISIEVPEKVVVERPKNRDHGDWATNVAMQFGKRAGMNPRDFATLVQSKLEAVAGVASVEIAGPGFLNIRVDAGAAAELARTILEAGERFGEGDALAGHTMNLEFVSANPTGPLHIGHTRWAALGDALGRILKANGADVTREFYINDAGAQMDKFGASILARAKGEDVPEGGYRGGYIDALAQQIVAAQPGLLDLPEAEAVQGFREAGYKLQLASVQQTLAEFDVFFDIYFSETELHAGGKVEEAVERLREQGHVMDQGGAVWLRTTDFGDDKDRVLIRANGEPTYFAADAAYYLSKRDRGFVEKIYLLGADHHGYVQRLKAIAACAGDDPAVNIEVLIGQLVDIEGAKLSKRAGNIIELSEMVEWIGKDAVRYTLARYPADSPISLNPEELQKKSNDNPVFYVQYAHARTRNVTRNAAEVGVSREAAFEPALLDHASEADLVAMLGEYPRVVAQAGALREPHRIARHLELIAGAYHAWYASCRVTPIGDEPVAPVHHTRLWLNDATGRVLANGLNLLGVSAPEKM
ncbi:arginine--tRNA ligase [Micrococcales bacterium 31B]|nr:arginine--tRNA ligase [Micrococcales bacterium 31B]